MGSLDDGYKTIKRLILSGEIAMGSRLIETRLAERLGLSRTPVREALRRLTSDGLVKFRPNHGYESVSYTPHDVASIYSCRALLESETVRLAIQHGLPDSIVHALSAVNEEADQLIAMDMFDETLRDQFLKLNHKFHSLLYSACPNQFLQRLITTTIEIPVGIRNYFHFSDDQLRESHQAHKSILRAAMNNDAERAAALMREHIWTAKDQMIISGDSDTNLSTREGATKYLPIPQYETEIASTKHSTEME